MAMVSQPCKYAKTHFKWVNFIAYKLYFNKLDMQIQNVIVTLVE